MLSLLSEALLTAVVLLLPATVAVFTVGTAARRMAATSPVRGVVVAVLVALTALGVAALLEVGPVSAAVIAILLGGSVVAWRPLTPHWATRGLVAWALTVDVGLLYLGYVLTWLVTADLSGLALLASGVMFLLECFVFLVGVGYLWEFVDVLARRTWSAYVNTAHAAERTTARPFVSLHVPTHNEPPDMVIATLEALLALEYDDYEILLVDNNTTDPALWRPVEAFCAQHERIVFLHLEDWPGFKSGALNYAVTRTDPRAEVIGIVDADYLVRPDFLSRCAPLFEDPVVSFVQTPQDYRGWEAAPYFRRLYFSYGYFFDVSQRSRNERNAAIFGGTMGLIRRSALADVGGWDEWCISEDAELSLRLLKAGGRGVHVEESFGHGIMPLTFEALKRQRFRWCFGGIQLLRMHWRSLLPSRRTDDNQLTLAQRWAYFVGALQWFGDVASVLFTGFLLIAAGDAALGDGLVVRRLSGYLLLCVAALVVLGAVRALALLRRTSGATWREAYGAFGIWIALGWTVAQAATRGLFAREGVFLRTPKVRGELSPGDALRGNRIETLLGLVCTVMAGVAIVRWTPSSVALGSLLLVHGLGYAAAPLNSLAAIRSDLPEELRRRRREMLAAWGRPAARRGGFVAATATVLLAGFMVFAAPVGGPPITRPPSDLEHDSRPAENPATTSPSGTTLPSESTDSVTPVASATATSSAPVTTGPPGSQATQATTAPTQANTVRPTQAPTTNLPAPPTPTRTHPGGGRPTVTPSGGKP